jgi:L-lactate dehydrogenase complex protein LldE
MSSPRPTVGLFVTCLVDAMRPSVGLAAVELLEQAGCDVVVPAAQTCCGQPVLNSGDIVDARSLARQVIEAFANVDYVVVPSGSCAGTIKVHYPELFTQDAHMLEAVRGLGTKTWELTSFLVQVMKVAVNGRRFASSVTYHDSCSGLRELGIRQQPRTLLAGVEGLQLREIPSSESCCGFGGTFCVKYPDISEKMVDAKADDVIATGADTVLGGDLGCLLNIAGRLHRRGARVRVYHVAEVLAGTASTTPAIGWANTEEAVPAE